MLAEAIETWPSQIRDGGFAIIPEIFQTDEIEAFLVKFQQSNLPRSKAGIRYALKSEAVQEIANDERLLRIATRILGRSAMPFNATVFDKSKDANWLVMWHQDTVLPLREKKDIDGWGPWSVKQGVTHSNAPASALENVLALRIHIDDSNSKNGSLRVLPGTHKLGVLSNGSIQNVVSQFVPQDCLVAQGGVLAMRPLLVHSSSKSHNESARRVLHIEYAVSMSIADGLELADVKTQ